MPGLFDPLTLRGVTFPNRIFVSPMCQYSSDDGLANYWHLVHLGSRAAGGAALIVVEASAVTAQGRITPGDLGIWGDQHVEPLAGGNEKVLGGHWPFEPASVSSNHRHALAVELEREKAALGCVDDSPPLGGTRSRE